MILLVTSDLWFPHTEISADYLTFIMLLKQKGFWSSSLFPEHKREKHESKFDCRDSKFKFTAVLFQMIRLRASAGYSGYSQILECLWFSGVLLLKQELWEFPFGLRKEK